MKSHRIPSLISLPLTLSAFLVVGCGGAAEDGSRDDGTVRAEDDDGKSGDKKGDEKGGDEGDAGADGPGGSTGDREGEGNDVGASSGASVDPVDGAPSNAGSSGGGAVAMPGSVGVAVPGGPPLIGSPIAGAPGSSEPLPPAEDCTTEVQSFGTNYCEVQQSCTDDFVYTWCSTNGTGAYDCSCSRGVGYNNHRLTGVDAQSACEVSVELCSGAVVPEYSEDVVCAPSAKSVGPSDCSTERTCGRVADLGDGVSAELTTEYQTAYCYNQGNGSLACSCNSVGTYQSYTLTDGDPATSCDYVMDLCVSGERPVLDECSLGEAYQDGNEQSAYCQLSQVCSQSGDGPQLSQLDYVSCQTTAGSSNCQCSTNSRSIRFQTDSAWDEACGDALAVCVSPTEIVPEGPLSCTRSYQDASGSHCSTGFQCTQAAVVDETTIGVYGDYAAYCQLAADGSWSCTCASGNNAAEITVSADDAWTVCTDAGELCADAVEVQIGNSGGGGVILLPGGGVVGVAPATPAPRPL